MLIFKINFGSEEHVGTLEAGQSHTIETNVGVMWVIKNNSGDLLKEYKSTEDSDQVCEVEESTVQQQTNQLLDTNIDDKLEV